MFLWSLPQALCLVSVCVLLTQGYIEDIDEIEVNYGDTYYNEITEREPQEHLTKWDKLFSMLENSQMRENMLLQYADDIIKVEIGSLRGEMLRFVAQYGGACGVAVETAGRRMALQVEARLREGLERHSRKEDLNTANGGNSGGNSNHQGALLQQLLSIARTQASRLAKLESSCLTNPGTGIGIDPSLGTGPRTPYEAKAGGFQPPVPEQEVTSPEEASALQTTLVAMVTELKQTRAELELALRSSRKRYLPAGCETALLFPMRSRRIYASVSPDLPLSLSSFTVSLWAKPVSISNRTVLFSYGTRRNPFEIQLLLSGTSALFTVGGEAHLVEGRGVVKAGGESGWTHLCGTWSSEQGMATLWADGRMVASTPGVAEGHVIPDGGSLQLGQEKNPGSVGLGGGGSGSGMPGFEGGFDAKLAFAGKMTGVNMWDRVLQEEEISQLALQEGEGCGQRGNVVAWGLTEIQPHGGAQFLN